jgi:cyclophilin family peptidyl-prolyl cis-trans isomerase
LARTSRRPSYFCTMRNTIIIVSLALLSSCVLWKGKTSKNQIIWVNSSMIGCTNPDQECLQVHDGEQLPSIWSATTPKIEGFEYKPGYTYKLEVSETKLAKEPKIVAVETQYTLLKILEKRPDLKEEGMYVYIQTSLGDIVGKLDMDRAPLTVANFVGLAEGTQPNTAKPIGTPFYDSIVFHRVIPSFMIQGGDPLGVGMGGPGYNFRNEIHPDLKHDKPGVFSMANSGPNTNGSQFFITHIATPWLDGNYNIFGNVIMGQEVVTAIGNTPRGQADKPKTPVYMTKVQIIRIGDKAKKFNAYNTFKSMQ